MLKNNSLKVFYTVLFLFIAFSQKAQAGFLDDAGLDPECMAHGHCSLDDVAAGFISLIRMLLGSIAAIALLFLVWGGVQWVWSGGNADKVKRGKDIFFNTIAALVLAFGSYMITSLFINDILQPSKTKWRVSSEANDSVTECLLQDIGVACNTSQQRFVCSGPDFGEECVTKCKLVNFIFRDELIAEAIYFECKDRNQYQTPAYMPLLCPGGDDNVCILFRNDGTAVTPSEVAGAPAGSIVHDFVW